MDKNRLLALGIRDALLAANDALEAWLCIDRTKDLRAETKEIKYLLGKNGITIDQLRAVAEQKKYP